MKITCQACQAKYTIADEKVHGKVVKIRCKKCAATIVVNGSNAPVSPEPQQAYNDPGHETSVELWTVNVADADQRTMTEQEIVAAYQGGVIADETFCWKDGMNDWLPLREIEALHEACNATRALTGAAPVTAAAAVAFAGPVLNAPRPHVAAGNGSAGVAAASPVAARRAGGRAPAADLFGGVAQAGGEEDVMTSAPAGMPMPHEDAQKMTGARNENSVLFSLNTLTSKGMGDRPAPLPGTEQSGLIDIRQLSAQMTRSADDKKKSRVDDIMNLGGGGAFGPSLGAPILSAPRVDQYAAAAAAAGAPAPRNRALIFAAVGAGAFVIVAAVGAATLLMRSKGPEGADKESVAGSASASEAPPTASASIAAAVAPPSESAAAAASAEPSASATASDTTGKDVPSAGPSKAATAPATKPKETTANVAPAPRAVESDQPFNMGEAKAKLGAAAASADGCKKPGGPTGTGRVVVTFAPSGAVQSAAISGPPFEGTPIAACVGARFRAVRVPAFSGGAFTVSKSFTINP